MPRVAAALLLTLVVSFSAGAAGHDLTTSPPTANQILPVVTGNGSGFTAAWIEPVQSHNAIGWRLASAAGEPIEGVGGAFDQTYVQSMAIAHSPSETLIVWITNANVYAERLSPSGAPLNMIAVTSGAYASDVAVAWNGSRYFVVWSNGYQLVGSLIAPGGSPTPPRPFFGELPVIGQPAPANFELAPDVAWDGRNFVIVFGEAPNIPCVLSVCPPPSPSLGHFRVMRVSADGAAIDSSPLTINGTHLRAHVASSGAESLIALDGISEVSAIDAHDESGLTLDAETPLFQWYRDVSSAVAWDGTTYTVGWRYLGADPGPSWLGAAHVTQLGSPFDYRVTASGGALPFGGTTTWGRPSIAVNEAGITAFAISESAGASSLARARLYLASELTPMPAAPSAPRNAVSYFSGNTARIDWQDSETPAGFVLEGSWDFGKTWGFYQSIAGDARTTSVYAYVGNLFRIRAFGSGGLSDGTITSIGSGPRRRAAGH
ncbi:MAG TPA: hypothetical protein VGQ21_06440 [Thermoanaerobaculia bacterium]|jgi:hypothetical protein|nr:hypothetical protein [Thermoanaerobaculia bacterium]